MKKMFGIITLSLSLLTATNAHCSATELTAVDENGKVVTLPAGWTIASGVIKDNTGTVIPQWCLAAVIHSTRYVHSDVLDAQLRMLDEKRREKRRLETGE